MADPRGEGPAITIKNDPDMLRAAGGAIDPNEGVRPPAPPRTEIRQGDYTAPGQGPTGEAPPLANPVLPGGGRIDDDQTLFSEEVDIVSPEPVPASTPQPAPPNPDRPAPRPGAHDALPDAQALSEMNRRRNIGEVVVEIDHQFEQRARKIKQTYHIVTSDPKHRLPIGTGYEHGIPMSVFGVPTETGRRYRITVEETSDSRPTPKRNPFVQGAHI